MQVLLSAYACRPNAGSEPGYGWNWATHLAMRGLEVHVLVAHRNQQSVEAGLQHTQMPNLHFHFVRTPEWATKSEAVHYSCWQAAALRAARKLNDEIRFDVAHHVTYGSVHVPSQLWRLGIPLIFGPVGGGQTAPAGMLAYFGVDKQKEQRRTLLTRALRLSPLHRRWLTRMNSVLAANRDTLSLVESLGCKNATLMCDAGLPVEYFAQQPRTFAGSRDALKLLWVGRFLPRKALPLALDVVKEVRRCNVTLTIAGDGLDPQSVHEMIRSRNLESRVHWKGERLSWSELRGAYAEHDALLFTSLRDSFGSQMLEAMAVGLPVITLDLHGAHDFVPESASFKVAVTTPEETLRNMVRAVEEFGALPLESRNEMSSQAWGFAKTLSWPARAEFAESLYRRVCSRSKPRRSAYPSQVAVAQV